MLRVGAGRRTILNRGISDLALIGGLAPAAWFRYGIGLTDDGGGLCSNWADQSGNGRALKATLTARPTIQADKSLLFDGVANFMKCDAFTLNQPETVYILGQQVTWTLNDVATDGATSGTGRIWQRGSTPNLGLFAGTSAGLTPLTVGTYGVVVAVFNGASSLIQVNSDAPSTGDAGAGNMGGFTLGAAPNPGNYANIQVKEVIIFSAAHDSNTRARVIRYLAQVGGLGI